jgi:hypothetical protein
MSGNLNSWNPEGTRKTTAYDSNSLWKSSNFAQNLQIWLKTRELTGNSVDFSLSRFQQSTCSVLGQDSKKITANDQGIPPVKGRFPTASTEVRGVG